MDAALAATLLKDLPTISDPITSAGWRAHLKRINLFFHIKGVADVPANNALKRTLLFYSLGNAGGQKAYHLSPDQRPAEETYANDLAELGKVFVPPQDSDMARSDYRKCKQAKNELFRPSTTRTHGSGTTPTRSIRRTLPPTWTTTWRSILFFFGPCRWNIFIWNKYPTEVFSKAFQ